MENSRSMHSVAKPTAVSKPNVCVRLVEVVVDRLGHADDAQPGSDSRSPIVSEPSPPMVISASMPACPEQLHQLLGAVDLDVGAVGLLDREARRVAAVGRAEDRAAEVARCRARTSRVSDTTPPSGYCSGNISPLKPSRMPTTSQPAVAAGERDGADDGVEPRGVAAPGGHGDALDWTTGLGHAISVRGSAARHSRLRRQLHILWHDREEVVVTIRPKSDKPAPGQESVGDYPRPHSSRPSGARSPDGPGVKSRRPPRRTRWARTPHQRGRRFPSRRRATPDAALADPACV